MKKILLLVSVICLMPTLALAKGKNLYRDCGIGALIFPNTGWAAVTSNIIWDWGTTASTTTSSSEDQCAGKDANAAKFLYQNYAVIEEETASGKGTHLETMLNILDCKNEAHPEIINSMRQNFTENVAKPEYAKQDQATKAENYYTALMTNVDEKFGTSCNTTH
ncbi:MAG: DUF3015 family protein [Pseudobdellovibrio sp.]